MENENNNEIKNEEVTIINNENNIANIDVAEVTAVLNDLPEQVASAESTPVEVPVQEVAPVQEVTPAPAEPAATSTPAASPTPADNSFVEKEKKVWPFVVLGVILILGGFFAYYYFIMTKPINVITKVFNSAYKNVEKGANEVSALDSSDMKSFNLDSTIAFTSDDESLKELSGIKANVKVGYDLTNKDKNIIDADIKMNADTLFNAAVTGADGKIFIDLKDKFNKVVYVESKEFSIDMSVLEDMDKDKINSKKDDYLSIVKIVKDAILENISEEKLSKKIMLKDISGKKVPVVEVYYEIDYPEYKKLHNGVINALLSDKKALETLAGQSDTTKLKEELNQAKDNLSELSFGSNINVVLDIEAISNKLVFLEVKQDEDTVTFVDKGSEAEVSIKSKEDGTVDITIDENENKIFVDAKLIDGESVNKFNLTIKAGESTKTSEKVSVSFVMYDPKEASKEMFNLTADVGIKINEEIKTVDMDNAVSVEQLSEKEQEDFMNALTSSMALLGSLDEM